MLTFQEIMKRIRYNCLKNNNGEAFDLNDSYSFSITWEKKYKTTRSLFGSKWVFQEAVHYDEVKKMEGELSKLPNGITYERTDVVTLKLDDSAKDFSALVDLDGYEHYRTTFIIHVSAMYAQSMLDFYNGRKYVIGASVPLQIIKKAELFKNKVLSSHREILNQLFKVLLTNHNLYNNRFEGYDGDSFSFEEIGMKPLQDESQLLGLMLALCEYGESEIPENEIWFIEYHKNIKDGVYYRWERFIKPASKKTDLKEW